MRPPPPHEPRRTRSEPRRTPPPSPAASAAQVRPHRISAVFLYYGGKMMHGVQSFLGDENFFLAAFEGVLMVFLLITGFLVAGMKSRWCAPR